MANVTLSECEEHRDRVYQEFKASERRGTPKWVFILIMGPLIALVFGCYAFVWASNGSVNKAIVEVKAELVKLDKSISVFQTKYNAHIENADKQFATIQKKLDHNSEELQEVRETVARIEKNSGVK